ncbi:hypothetical protein FRC14_000748 [Serendipita sp. 396]|nr:hypothetical protein FRC14_000748 [Serendipita sp. 396]
MVSAALNEYLSEHGNGETFDGLLAKPPIKELAPFDGSHPLTDYFISSSHNTYLLANQLWGAASPQAYTTALHGLAARAPARCVELDVWWTSKKGPILTHGHTLTGSVPFQEACLAIGNAIGPNDLPAWISLECHVDADKQPQLSLRGGKKRTGKAHLKLTIVGGDDIPHAEEGKSRSLYVVAKLFKGAEKLEWKTKSIKDHDADPMFLSTVEWDWEDDDLVFLRVELKEDVWGRDQEVASYTLLVDRLATGLRFWPLFDKTGMPSVGRLLVDVDFKVGA